MHSASQETYFEAAEYLRSSESTLAKKRLNGNGPRSSVSGVRSDIGALISMHGCRRPSERPPRKPRSSSRAQPVVGNRLPNEKMEDWRRYYNAPMGR